MSQNDILKRFGERIRELRIAKGWYNEKLSFESELISNSNANIATPC
jgi:hypothetical protein